MLFYVALRGLGVDVDIRHPDADLSGYRLIVAPALQIISPDRARHLEVAAKHARLVFGPPTGFRDVNGKVHPGGQPGPLTELTGCKMMNFDALPPHAVVHSGGHLVETWAESYQPIGGTCVVAYDDGPLQHMASIVRNGHCLTIGAWSRSLIEELLESELTAIGIEPMRLPDGLRRVSVGDRTIWLDFDDSPRRTPTGLALDPVSWRIEPSRKD